MMNTEWAESWGTPSWMVERRRVLVIEDAPEMSSLLRRILAELPVDLDLAEDGIEGLQRVQRAESREDPFELVLLNMQMPRCDSYEAARHLREEGFAGVIVGVTDNSDGLELEAALEAGCDVFLPKPVAREQIARTVRSSLDIG